jgi:nucleoside-diphosphate-sugar epimerase
MRVLLTGAQGFIGRRLVTRLAAEGAEVLAVDQVPAREPLPPDVRGEVSDLGNSAALVSRHWKSAGPFSLVHLAWDLQRRDRWSAQAGAVRVLAGLIEDLTSAGLERVIAMGSAEEYGTRGGRLAEDDAPGLPLSPYGWAKRAAGEMVASWAGRTGRRALWLRPFVVYGPGQGGDMAIPYAIRRARERAAADFTDGLQQRDFVFVDDVVEAIVGGLSAEWRGAELVNLGWGRPVALRDVLDEIARLLGAGDLFRFGARPRRVGEPEVQVADTARAEERLGWRPRVEWREGVRRTCGITR